jgi:hypothetical protein
MQWLPLPPFRCLPISQPLTMLLAGLVGRMEGCRLLLLCRMVPIQDRESSVLDSQEVAASWTAVWSLAARFMRVALTLNAGLPVGSSVFRRRLAQSRYLSSSGLFESDARAPASRKFVKGRLTANGIRHFCAFPFDYLALALDSFTRGSSGDSSFVTGPRGRGECRDDLSPQEVCAGLSIITAV